MRKVLLPLFLVYGITILLGSDLAATGPATAAAADVVAATVGDDSIDASDVSRLLATVIRDKEVSRQALPTLQAQALEEIVQRRLVLAYARRTGAAATPAEVDAAKKEFVAKLESQGKRLADHLKSQNASEADLKRQLSWNIVWGKFLARYVTEELIEAYFKDHHRELDGSEVTVSHLLLRPAAGARAQTNDELVRQAQAIRQEIASGKLTFAEAARRYSQGPSARQGGLLGPITRHGSMGESFCRAAFALQPGQVSEPVKTAFGVHLIRVDQVKPGAKKLADVRGQIDESLARELMEKIATSERRTTPVKYTGKVPYFKPGARDVVSP